MQPSALSLIPPVIVLISAITTRKLSMSMIIGIVCGAFIASQGAPVDAFGRIAHHFWDQIIEVDNILIYSFLIFIGMLISIISHTGAAQAFARTLQKKVSNAQQVEASAFGMAFILSIDDYLSSLTVGHIMRPLADTFRVAREKLAYIVHTFSGPLVMLIPISTWAAFIIHQIEQAGISTTGADNVKLVADPFYIYLRSIVYMYYPLFTVMTAVFVSYCAFSYGPMAEAEQNVQKNMNRKEETISTQNNAHISDLLLPMLSLLGAVFLGMLYTGDAWLMGGSHTVVQAFKDNIYAFHVLTASALLALGISLFLSFKKKQLSCKELAPVLYEGITMMWPGIVLIVLASTLGALLRIDLQTGQYLARLFLNAVSLAYLPLIFFVGSAITSTLIGTAWGTIALLLPIGIPMVYTLAQGGSETAMIHATVIAIGALLSGSVFGDHTSPISAAGIIAAVSSGCEPLDHIYTQYPYAISPFLGALTSFFVVGQFFDQGIMGTVAACISGIAVTSIFHLFFQKFWRTQR